MSPRRLTSGERNSAGGCLDCGVSGTPELGARKGTHWEGGAATWCLCLERPQGLVGAARQVEPRCWGVAVHQGNGGLRPPGACSLVGKAVQNLHLFRGSPPGSGASITFHNHLTTEILGGCTYLNTNTEWEERGGDSQILGFTPSIRDLFWYLL